METEERTKDLREYLAAFRRRWKQIALTVIALFAISAAVAALLPAVYRSTATILIEQQEVPPDLVRSTISSYADQRIQTISQQVMTRANLARIVDKYNLYPRERATKTSEEILQRLAKDIKLDLVKADVIDPRNGTKTNATIAFNLSYDGETPFVAQQVANELVTLFLNENLKTRQQKTEETAAFLADEADKLAKHVAETEAKIAAFKARNEGRLPELVQLNMTLRDRTDSEIRELDRDLSSLEERKIYLQAQLAQLKPNAPLMAATGERILDPVERLKVLKAQYASLSGVYSSKHPDVVKVRREIAALEKQTGASSDPPGDSAQLASLQAQLATLRQKYSDDYPDVVKLKKSIGALQARPSTVGASDSAKPDNPAYIELQAALESTLSEFKSARAKRAALEAKLGSYEARLQQTPQVEREYLELTRDHDTSVARFREIKAKQMQANIGEELEKDRKGERFSLIDPPQLPQKPASPNRPAILLLGLVLSLGGGVGSAAMLESLDESVRGSSALAGLVKAPVLGIVPRIETDAERRRKRTLVRIAVAGTLAALALAVIVVHLFVIPLDVLWFRMLRWLDAYTAVVAMLDFPSA